MGDAPEAAILRICICLLKHNLLRHTRLANNRPLHRGPAPHTRTTRPPRARISLAHTQDRDSESVPTAPRRLGTLHNTHAHAWHAPQLGTHLRACSDSLLLPPHRHPACPPHAAGALISARQLTATGATSDSARALAGARAGAPAPRRRCSWVPPSAAPPERSPSASLRARCAPSPSGQPWQARF